MRRFHTLSSVRRGSWPSFVFVRRRESCLIYGPDEGFGENLVSGTAMPYTENPLT